MFADAIEPRAWTHLGYRFREEIRARGADRGDVALWTNFAASDWCGVGCSPDFSPTIRDRRI
ncbi:hypothetical protein AB7M56_002657 [Bradyrhizobium elkanii]|uniref:Uncharacterized protein n=1 Tax=Bradyrhizobium elkanii TaxID=29448 RepID=A0ABV4F563_BRAEL|nr:hypothetical protein [Bradyrhizobium elkanii]MCP1968662.1 hypothetical protein [Bradyrhizobium elkanii]MCP1984577.1 hypothetical protein [Bradyrhizobium elkanii]MCS3567666.1 hypothetical protein [Bradyrhizobium elkanii]MCS4072407.1 hypothetical protein [Bradyrhizobium elkanii]